MSSDGISCVRARLPAAIADAPYLVACTASSLG